MNSYIKWFFVVGFNTIFSLMFASDFMTTVPGATGILLGITCFILLYAKLDVYLLESKRITWHKSLIFAAVITGVLSLYPVMPMISGALALDVTASLFNIPSTNIQFVGFFPIFFTTLFSGLVLSSAVVVIAIILRFTLFKNVVVNMNKEDMKEEITNA